MLTEVPQPENLVLGLASQDDTRIEIVKSNKTFSIPTLAAETTKLYEPLLFPILELFLSEPSFCMVMLAQDENPEAAKQTLETYFKELYKVDDNVSQMMLQNQDLLFLGYITKGEDTQTVLKYCNKLELSQETNELQFEYVDFKINSLSFTTWQDNQLVLSKTITDLANSFIDEPLPETATEEQLRLYVMNVALDVIRLSYAS
jgi:hypothetical protein